MPIYERGGTFMVSVGSGKDRYRGHAKTRGEAEALELAQTLIRKNAKQTGSTVPKGAVSIPAVEPVKVYDKTLGEAYKRLMALHWKGTKGEKTQAINATSIIKTLGGDDVVMADITAEDIANAVLELEDQGNSGSTINKKVSCLNMMFKMALDYKWVSEIPKMLRRRENQHRVRFLDEKEEAHVLSLCDHLGLYDLKDYVVCAIDTGFRRGELLGFKSRDYSNGLLHLHAGSTKSDEARSVPATARVAEILKRRGGRPVIFQELDPHSLRWQWEKIRGLMQMDDDPQFVVHMLRHTCASRLVQRRVPLAVVQKWMGHKKIETTLRYAHLAPDSLLMGREALEMGMVVSNPVEAPEMASADF